MRLITALVGALAVPTTCLAQQKLDVMRPNEAAFQCGSAFAIVGQAYADAGKSKESAKFQGKAQRLFVMAEAEFARRGKTKLEAEAHMQKHVDSLVRMEPTMDPRIFATYIKHCETRFPD